MAKKSNPDDIRTAIELRAYYIWEREGRPEGRQHAHWALAEAEICGEQPAKKAAAPKKSVTKTPVEKKASADRPGETAKTESRKSGNGIAPAAKLKKSAKPKAGKSLPRTP